MDSRDKIHALKIDYIRANRCWRSNNFKGCLLICDQLTKKLAKLQAQQTSDTFGSQSSEIERLKNLTWYIKIRCLADDYYLNEPLLLNDEDIDDQDNQIRSVSNQRKTAGGQSTAIGSISRPITSRPVTGRQLTTAGSRTETRHRTAAILTGKRSSFGSRQSSQGGGGGASSYRPLTTSLTATQTAFSRSTRPLLKYATCRFLAKDLFEYLYNVQTITNRCPDYRQCLEYLNLVQKSTSGSKSAPDNPDGVSLGGFWLNSFGMCYYNLRMNKEAHEFFTRAIALQPKNLDSYTWLVKVYLRTNQPYQVLKTCQLGLKQSKSSILYNWMARVQSLMDDLYKANLSLKESLKFHPTNIEALANVGHFAFYGDKLELSLRCFERIQQLSINQSASIDSDYQGIASSAQLLNNLALANFYCGQYHKVVSLFFRALLCSPNKEVTSDIWYNLSFIPISCGFVNLSIACLKLSLRNDSQNIEALNNLGVLKCHLQLDDNLHFANRQELWGLSSQKSSSKHSELENVQSESISFDEIETFFAPPAAAAAATAASNQQYAANHQPEMLYNMAMIKKKRGQLLASMGFCQLYSQHDPNNYHVQNTMKEIRQLVSHNS